jgi:hypothetical protein
MRIVALISLAALAVGCSTSEPADTDTTDASNNGDTDNNGNDTDDSDGDSGPFPSSFTFGQYRISKLALVTETDVDQDGVTDNNLPNALNLVDLLIPTEDFSLPTFNGLLEANLDAWSTLVLMEAAATDGDLTLDLLLGVADVDLNLSVDPASYDDQGTPKGRLDGEFTSEADFWAGPATMEIPVTFVDYLDPLPVALEDASFDGGMTVDSSAGTLTAALPIDELINKVIEPLIDPNGVDIDNDGVVESKAEVLALIESIAPSAGDIDLGGGRTGVSCRFTYVAEAVSF